MAVAEALFPERSKSASDGSKRACRGLSAHSWPAGLPHPRCPISGSRLGPGQSGSEILHFWLAADSRPAGLPDACFLIRGYIRNLIFLALSRLPASRVFKLLFSNFNLYQKSYISGSQPAPGQLGSEMLAF